MSTPRSGLRDENDIFGETEPSVSVEVDRDEHIPAIPGEADGRPFAPTASSANPGEHDAYAPAFGSTQESEPDPYAPEPIAGVTSPSRRGSSARFLTDVICDMGLAPRERVDLAIESSRNEGITPERVLLASGAITSDGLARALAERYGLDHLDLDIFPVNMGAANLVVGSAAKRYQAVPVAFVDKRTLLLAMADPSNVLAVDDVAIMTGYEVRVAVAAPDAIGDLISRMARLEDVVSGDAAAAEEAEEASADIVNLRETADDAPVVKLVNQIVAQAVELGASDVHMAPDGHEVRVRVHVERHPAGHHDGPAAHGRRRRFAREDHGRTRHLRAAPAPGRPRQPDRRLPPHRPARGHAAERARRVDRDAHPRQGLCGDEARRSSAWQTLSAIASNAPSTKPTAPCS